MTASHPAPSNEEPDVPPLSCRIRGHRYPDWTAADADVCDYRIACMKCGNEMQLGRHKPGPKVSIDPCHSLYVCTRCKQVLNRYEHHDYGPWEYDRDNACTTHETCRGCGERSPAPPQHQWSEWRHDRPDTCEGRQTCTRCGESRKVRTSHPPYTWKPDRPGSCVGREQCPRCGDTRDRDTRHEYDSVPVASSRTCWRKKCERCGKSTDQPHQYGWSYVSNVHPDSAESKRNLARLRREGGQGREDKCAQVSVCATCAHVHAAHFQHDHLWKQVQEGTTAYQKCRRCGARESVSGQGGARP